MKTFGAICGVLSILFFLATSAYWLKKLLYQRIFDRAFKVGYDAGVKQGKLEESNWWLNAEKESDQARQQIWREEGVRGEEAGWP